MSDPWITVYNAVRYQRTVAYNGENIARENGPCITAGIAVRYQYSVTGEVCCWSASRSPLSPSASTVNEQIQCFGVLHFCICIASDVEICSSFSYFWSVDNDFHKWLNEDVLIKNVNWVVCGRTLYGLLPYHALYVEFSNKFLCLGTLTRDTRTR